MTQEAGVSDVQSAADALEAKWSQPEADEAKSESVEVESAEPAAAKAAPEEPEEVSDDQAPEEEAEDVRFESIDQLAEALEMTPDEFLSSIKAKAKVNGEEIESSLSELISGYQREADYTRKTQEVAQIRREAEAEIAQQREQITQTHQQLSQLIQLNEQALMGEYQSVDWQTLRIEDPAEYAAKVQDFNQRQSQIAQWKQYGMQQWQMQQQELAQKQQAEFQERLKDEAAVLVDRIPEWRDQKVAETEKKAVAEYLIGIGYKPEEIGNLADHRAVEIARKAYLFDQQSSKTEVAKKKVRDLPKVLKPGAKKGQQQKLAEARDKMRRKLRKSGSMDDAAALILDRI